MPAAGRAGGRRAVAGGRGPPRPAPRRLRRGWPAGRSAAVSALGAAPAPGRRWTTCSRVDLAAVADAATARRGSTGPGRAGRRRCTGRGRPRPRGRARPSCSAARCTACVSEPAAARLGACTTPGARPDAVVVDVGAGTIDVIAPDGEVVAAGAGDLLTAAVAETLGVPPRRGRLGQARPVPAGGGQPAVRGRGRQPRLPGPARRPPQRSACSPPRARPGCCPSTAAQPGRMAGHPAAAEGGGVRGQPAPRLVRTLGRGLGQVLIVGGPAGDDELLGVLLRSLPDGVTAGRGQRRRHAARPAGRPPARRRPRPRPRLGWWQVLVPGGCRGPGGA